MQHLDRLELRLYDEPDKMGRSYLSFTRELRRLLKKRSGKFFEKEVPFVDSGGNPTARSYKYRIPVLPSRDGNPKYFVVDLVPPPSKEGAEPVPLLFEFSGMYFQGFLADKFWWVFQDAEIIQDLNAETMEAYMKILSFNGSYQHIGQDFSSFVIGIEGQKETYINLSQFSSGKLQGNQLKRAMCRVVVTICEAIRFAELLHFLVKVLEDGEMYKSLDEDRRNFSDHFNDWGNYCKIIRGGEAEFKKDPPSGFASYESLLQFVLFLLPIKT